MEKYNAPEMEVVRFDDNSAIMLFGEGDRGPFLPCHAQSGNQDANSACQNH